MKWVKIMNICQVYFTYTDHELCYYLEARKTFDWKINGDQRRFRLYN